MSNPKSNPPEIMTAKGAWMVWVVPVIALLIGGYLVYKEFSTRGPMITITFEEGMGLEANKTRLVCKGVVVGVVESLQLSESLETVEVKARLAKPMRHLARHDTRFWIVRPEINLTGVSGLDTLMSGPYLEVDPGKGPFRSAFVGMNQHPRNSLESHEYILHTPRRQTAVAGVPVRFRGLRVGTVQSVTLSPDSTEVLVAINIEEPYFRLIRRGTKFWDAGGVDMKVNLLGAQIRAGSLESILAGAIEFATPAEAAELPIAQSGSHFHLHAKADEKWLQWQAAIDLQPPDTGNLQQAIATEAVEVSPQGDASLLESEE